MLSFLGVESATLHIPKMLTDNGGEFCGISLEEALKELNVHHLKISPYNSSSNLVERSHRDLRSEIRMVEPTWKNIEYVVRLTVCNYNHSSKSSLQGFSPMQIFAGISRGWKFEDLQFLGRPYDI